MRRFDPRSISGLVCWLRAGVADTLTSGRVAQATDLSGNNNHGAQPVNTCRPVPGAAGYRGRPYWACGGVAGATISKLLFPANAFDALTAAEVFFSFRRAEDPPNNGVGGLHGLDSVQSLIPYIDGKVYDGLGSSARKTTNVSTAGVTANFCIYNVTTTTTEWTCRLNGTQLYTTPTNTVAWPSAPSLLCNVANSSWLYGEFYDFVLINHKVTAAERSLISAFLQT